MLRKCKLMLFLKKALTNAFCCAIIVKHCERGESKSNAGMAELADARDLKSRGTFSRTGSRPVSGTIHFTVSISRGRAAW